MPGHSACKDLVMLNQVSLIYGSSRLFKDDWQWLLATRQLLNACMGMFRRQKRKRGLYPQLQLVNSRVHIHQIHRWVFGFIGWVVSGNRSQSIVRSWLSEWMDSWNLRISILTPHPRRGTEITSLRTKVLFRICNHRCYWSMKSLAMAA
jgi:hypothetical protein